MRTVVTRPRLRGCLGPDGPNNVTHAESRTRTSHLASSAVYETRWVKKHARFSSTRFHFGKSPPLCALLMVGPRTIFIWTSPGNWKVYSGSYVWPQGRQHQPSQNFVLRILCLLTEPVQNLERTSVAPWFFFPFAKIIS